MDDINLNEIITREELLNGNKIGIHRITDKPIIGYKAAFYSLKNEIQEFWNPCLLEVEIPIGALVVKAIDNIDYEKKKIAGSLRTDKLFVKSIEGIDFYDKHVHKQLSSDEYKCRSFWYHDFEYTSQEMHPKHPLSLSLMNDCESGLHFFLHKQEADSYLRPKNIY